MSARLNIRLGTRAHKLARWQAEWVTTRLTALGALVELIPISTSGDVVQSPIGASTPTGFFTKEIQKSLLENQIDLAVHSLKDLPTDEVEGLLLAAVPERASVRDALVCGSQDSLQSLPSGAVIGTGSLRRQAQLLHARPDLKVRGIRGNLDTRLRKLDEGQYDAIILAEAGLQRLGLADRISETLPVETVLPAIGQGALGLESRNDDDDVCELLAQLDHQASHAAVQAERTLLAALQGGCLAPIAAWGRIEDGRLQLSGRVISPDGQAILDAEASGDIERPEVVGFQVANELIVQGASDLIELSRRKSESTET